MSTRRLVVRLLAAALGAVGLAVVYERYDPVVASNVVFRATKVLDLVFVPGTVDPALPAIEAYLDGKRAEIHASREAFVLWDYFDLRGVLGAARYERWSEVVVLRMELWARKLEATGDRRFTIEKDKCVMLEMLATLRLPHPRVRRTWRAADYDAAAVRAYLVAATFPAILKVGHIHQQKSTLFLPDAASVARDADSLVAWTSAKMATKFDDGSQMWAASTNKLYDKTEACLIVQDVVNPGAFAGARDGNAMRPTELLVEVVWGVPMHAVAVVDIRGEMLLGKPQHQDTVEFFVRSDGWACYKWPKGEPPGAWFGKWYVNAHSHVRLHRKLQETWFKTRDPARGDRGWRRTCAGFRHFERRACVRDGVRRDLPSTRLGYGPSPGLGHSRRLPRVQTMGWGKVAADVPREGPARCRKPRPFRRPRRAQVREYRFAQRKFWAKYAAVTPHLGAVWATCGRLARGVGADYTRCDVFVGRDGAVDVNEISLSSYWGNTLSDAWQRRVLDLWVSGYDAAPDGGGAAFARTYSGPLPSPTYAPP